MNALGKVESELKTCPIVDNICVYGESSKHFVVALIVPNPEHLTNLALTLGILDTSLENLCSLPTMARAVEILSEEHGRKCKHRMCIAGLVPHFVIQSFVLLSPLQAN